jgi:hypothetical protein
MSTWRADNIERELSESIARRMAERSEYIRASDDEYRKRCTEIEDQIASYVGNYVKDVTKVVSLIILITACYLLPIPGKPMSTWLIFVVACAILGALYWWERRQRKSRILKSRKFCTEPTAEDHELALALGDESTCAIDEDLAQMRDSVRRSLILAELRFRNRYGVEP